MLILLDNNKVHPNNGTLPRPKYYSKRFSNNNKGNNKQDNKANQIDNKIHNSQVQANSRRALLLKVLLLASLSLLHSQIGEIKDVLHLKICNKLLNNNCSRITTIDNL